MKWTVVRFPDGSWSTGGSPDDPDYALCEVYTADAADRKAALRKVQNARNYARRKARRLAGEEAQ